MGLTRHDLTMPLDDGLHLAWYETDDGKLWQPVLLVGTGPDGDSQAVAVDIDGKLQTTGGGSAAPISKAAMDLGGGNWFYDLRFRDDANTVPTERGDIFDLTAIAYQGGTVSVYIVPPAPDEDRLFFATFHKDATDPTGFGALIVPELNAGYDEAWIGPVLSTLADGDRLQVTSTGDDSFTAMNITAYTGPTAPFALPSALSSTGHGLLSTFNLVTEQTGRLEGVLDRLRFVAGVGIAPFDPTPFIGAGNGPVTGLDFGAPTPGGDIAVLGITDGTDPTDPWCFHVENDGSLTPWVDPQVFNPPGNGYRIVLNAAGDPEDGRMWMAIGNDVSNFLRGGSSVTPTDPTVRWLSYPAGTPI